MIKSTSKSRKGRFATHIVSFLCAILIMAAAVWIPSWLLTRQEEEKLSEVHYISVKSVDTMTDTSEDIPVSSVIERYPKILLVRLLSWEAGEKHHLREPYDHEMSMEQAVASAKRELQILIDEGAIEDILVDQLSFYSAELSSVTVPEEKAKKIAEEYSDYTVPVHPGCWNISFNNIYTNSMIISVVCDAETGFIRVLTIRNEGMDYAKYTKSWLRNFARYHGVTVPIHSVEESLESLVIRKDGLVFKNYFLSQQNSESIFSMLVFTEIC